MALPVKLGTLLATTTVAASVGWWVSPWGPGGSPEDTPPRPPPWTAPVAGPANATICVARDRVFRATREDGTCPPDHEVLSLDEDDEGLCELCDPNEEPTQQPEAGARDAIERRIRALENTAYFEVVTKDGRPVFRVQPGGVRVFNQQGTAVAAIGTSENGGYFSGRSTAGTGDASIGASGTRAGVRLMEMDLSRLELSTQDGKASFRLPSAAGTIAGVGQTVAGGGALLVGTLAGHMRASFTVPASGGMIAVAGEGKSGGIALLEPSIGGGMLGIDDTRGNAAVKMGHNGNRYGIVLAGPVLGFPLIPKSGLPGSYFMGCASDVRPACVPTVDP